jgi:hypothetical protein
MFALVGSFCVTCPGGVPTNIFHPTLIGSVWKVWLFRTNHSAHVSNIWVGAYTLCIRNGMRALTFWPEYLTNKISLSKVWTQNKYFFMFGICWAACWIYPLSICIFPEDECSQNTCFSVIEDCQNMNYICRGAPSHLKWKTRWKIAKRSWFIFFLLCQLLSLRRRRRRLSFRAFNILRLSCEAIMKSKLSLTAGKFTFVNEGTVGRFIFSQCKVCSNLKLKHLLSDI